LLLISSWEELHSRWYVSGLRERFAHMTPSSFKSE
jgi:hypothetical protein